MKQRIITAIIGIPILLLFLLGPILLTDLFILVAGLIAAGEFLLLTRHNQQHIWVYFGAGLLLLLGIPILLQPQPLLAVLLLVGAVALGLYFAKLMPLWMEGVFYLGIPLATMISLRPMEDGIKWILVFLLATWITDSFALFGGRAFGKTQLTPISPKKTREGTVIGILCGIIGTILVGVVLGLWKDHALTIILAAVLLPPLAVIGDLIESKIKRTYGVKDSGNLFPGHGGMLDRVDSLLLTGPALWVLVVLTAL